MSILGEAIGRIALHRAIWHSMYAIPPSGLIGETP